jgi:hypothetical protein
LRGYEAREGEGKIFFFLLSWIRKEKKLEGPQTRDERETKRGGGKKNLNSLWSFGEFL